MHCHEFSVNGKTVSQLDQVLGATQCIRLQINIHGNTGIVDTGTTLCLVSNDLVQAVYRAISGAKLDNASGLWLIPNKAESMSDNSFDLQTQFLMMANASP